MSTNRLEDLIAEVCMYLHTSDDMQVYDKITKYMSESSMSDTSLVIRQECIELRENTVSFKVRETQKRIIEIDKLINGTRHRGKTNSHELACLEALYQQSKQVNERLSLLYKLDLLLLTVIKESTHEHE